MSINEIKEIAKSAEKAYVLKNNALIEFLENPSKETSQKSYFSWYLWHNLQVKQGQAENQFKKEQREKGNVETFEF